MEPLTRSSPGIRFKVLEICRCVYIFNVTTTAKQGLATDEDSTVSLTVYVGSVQLAGGNKQPLEMLKEK